MDGILQGRFCPRQISYSKSVSSLHQDYYTLLSYQQPVNKENLFYNSPFDVGCLTQPHLSGGHRVRSGGHGRVSDDRIPAGSRDRCDRVHGMLSCSNSQTSIKQMSRDVEVYQVPTVGRDLHACPKQAENGERDQYGQRLQQVHSVHECYVEKIRLHEKDQIKSFLLPGSIIQVCGPPMVGKSVLVDQVMSEVQERNDHISVFTFNCKQMQSLKEILHANHQDVFGGRSSNRHAGGFDTAPTIKRIKSVLNRHRCHHYVFVFHKTEALRASGEDHNFLAFLYDLVKADFEGRYVKVTAVFTTYKQIPGDHFKAVHVDILSDPLDIVAMLQHYAPESRAQEYVTICQNLLCLPEAVRRLAEEYLESSTRPDRLQSIVCSDGEFWSMIFQKRVAEVKGWLTSQEVDLIVNVLRCQVDPLTEASVKQVYEHFNPQQDCDHWSVCFRRLVKKYVFLRSPTTGSLMVHPLVQYFCKASVSPTISASFDDHSSKSWTMFLCRVLMKADQAMQVIGDKGHVFGYRADDWPYTKHLLEMAIHNTTGGYGVVLKVAVVGRQLIMSSFPNEAQQFYSLLVQTARYCGTPSQMAVMEACLAMTTTLTKDSDWRSADQHFESALKILKTDGPSFFYTWTLRKRAVTLHRQGHHMLSLKLFKEAKMISTQMTLNAVTSNDDELLSVPEGQVQEDFISAEIHETIPLIFSGESGQARSKLTSLCSTVKHLRRYPDYVILLNSIGLTYERDDTNYTKALTWYKKSYKERQFLQPLSPENLSVPMNNMGMMLFQMGYYDQCEQYLQKVIAVRRQTEWQHMNTALTLFNLGRVKWATRRVLEAYGDTVEALNILKKKFSRHHFTLVVRLTVAHIRVTMGQHGHADGKVTSEHLDEVLQSDKDMAGHDHLEGQHSIMSYHEHNILIHWKQSTDKYSHHLCELVKLYREVFRRYARSAPGFLHLQQRRKFAAYLQATKYESLDYNELANLVTTFCQSCRITKSVYDITAWSRILAVRNPALTVSQYTNSCSGVQNQLTSLNSTMNISLTSGSANCTCLTHSTNNEILYKPVSHTSEDFSYTQVKCTKNDYLFGYKSKNNSTFQLDAEMSRKTDANKVEEILALNARSISELDSAACIINDHTIFNLSLFHGNPVMQTRDANQSSGQSSSHELPGNSQAHNELTRSSYAHHELSRSSHACHELTRSSHACHELTRSSHECHELTRSSHACHELTRSSHACHELTRSSHACHELTRSSHACHELTRSSHECHELTRSSHAHHELTENSYAHHELTGNSHAHHELTGSSHTHHEMKRNSQTRLELIRSSQTHDESDTGTIATQSNNESNLPEDTGHSDLCDCVNITSFTGGDSGGCGSGDLSLNDSLTSSLLAEFDSTQFGDEHSPDLSLVHNTPDDFCSLGLSVMPDLVSLSSPVVQQFYNYL